MSFGPVPRLALTAALAASVSGCSLVFVRKPPSGHENMRSFSCTESRIAPILDLGGTVLAASAAAFVSPSSSSSGRVTISSGSSSDAAIGFGVAAALGASAFLGFRWTNACRSALRGWMTVVEDPVGTVPSARPNLTAWPTHIPLLPSH